MIFIYTPILAQMIRFLRTYISKGISKYLESELQLISINFTRKTSNPVA